MPKEFRQIQWDEQADHACRQIVRQAVFEDLQRTYDWTTVALVARETRGEAHVVARETGVICGLQAAAVAIDEMDADIQWKPVLADGDRVASQTTVAVMSGSARDLLTAERLVLNLIGHLSGIASLTRQYVDAIAASQARLYDTRKTTPGLRVLEKFAVRCGGGHNHRGGLHEAVLIKDNHLALGRVSGEMSFSPATAVRRCREFLTATIGAEKAARMIIEVEVDNLSQLAQVLPEGPDIVLLDNMDQADLSAAVRMRAEGNWASELEASGGLNLKTIAGIASTGVDRISVGAITHSARRLDVALDWA